MSNSVTNLAKKIGLSNSQFDELKRVLSQFSELTLATVYGSRAKGSFHHRSDLDLALTLSSNDRHLIAQIKLAFDASDLIPSVDVQNIAEIRNSELLAHIQRRGVDVYRQGSGL